MLRPTWRLMCAGLVLLAGTSLQSCATIDFDYPKEESIALTGTGDTHLGVECAKFLDKRPGESAFYLMADGTDALAARLVMAERAERSIDTQYYLIKNDAAGYLFIDALLDAADRGVRVRLLLDDIETSGYDKGMRAMDAHPNIEIRLFNPFVRGFSRMLYGARDFRRVNRRMHNKTFTADNQVTIIGGRNIGGEYFNARPDYNFGDLDVLCFGPVVQEVSNMFDLYWNDYLAVPVLAVVGEQDDPEAAEKERADFRTRVQEGWTAALETRFAAALEETMLAPSRGEDVLLWAPYQLVYDPPEKARTKRDEDLETILGPLSQALDEAEEEFLLVSPYFVPLESGIAYYQELRDRGVECVVITNSLESNNHAVVHTGYYPAREPLLKMGVKLYEIRPDAQVRGSERTEAEASRSGLHTKAFMVDRKRLFIGSFNFDPRSAAINTEMGIILEAPELCQELVQEMEDDKGMQTYRVYLNEKGYMRWATMQDGKEVVYIREPAGYWRKLSVSFLGLFPIKSQL